MKENEIKNMLDALADYQSQRDAVMLEKQRLLDEIYTAEIKARMAEIEAEFAGKTEAVNANIAALEAEIKKAVIAHGASVKGSTLNAIFAKGRYSYSEEPKNGYEQATVYRKLGEPSVSIRAAK